MHHSEHGESLKSRIFHSYLLYFWLPGDNFSQKPKHVVSNGPDINVVVSNGWYCVFVHHVLCHNGMSSVDTLSCAKIVYCGWQISEMYVWGVGGMLFTGEGWSTRNETSPSVTSFATNLIWTGMGWNPGLHGERPATNSMSHGAAINTCARVLLSTDISSFNTCSQRKIKYGCK